MRTPAYIRHATVLPLYRRRTYYSSTCSPRTILARFGDVFRVIHTLTRDASSSTSPASSSPHTNTVADTPILRISDGSIHEFGDSNTAPPLIHSISWTILSNQAWTVISPSTSTSSRAVDGKATLFSALMGHRRFEPFQGAIFPSMYERGRDATRDVKLVGFTHTSLMRGSGGIGRDWTARYGAVRGEERRTLREVYFPELAKPLETLAVPSLVIQSQREQLEIDGSLEKGSRDARAAEQKETQKLFEELVDKLELADILDRPVIALSNGQTRKARIVKALLHRPEVLLLDEPLSKFCFSKSDAKLSCTTDVV